jgi:uncharacterized protein
MNLQAMITRDRYLKTIDEIYEIFPICGILGPRQCGKTTLAHQYAAQFKGPVHHFDLEDPSHFDQLKNPKTTLDPLEGLIIIDEIQHNPALFSYLRVLADYSDKRIMILGSASGPLLNQSAESLAGRVDYLELPPFSLDEVDDYNRLWSWGGFPKSYLAKNYGTSYRWRKAYINSFVERDLPTLGIQLNRVAMHQLLMMLAHCHGNLLNYTDLGRSLGATDMTIRRYIDILSATFMVRYLRPWHENLSKRQVKAPKIFFKDSGILHTLLGIHESGWSTSPSRGASFEGFAIEEIIRHFGHNQDYYFWRTQAGAELDLLMIKDGKRYGFEIKLSDAPPLTASMRIALNDLRLEHLYIVNALDVQYQKEDAITVIGVQKIKTLKI